MSDNNIRVTVKVRPLIKREKEAKQTSKWRVNGNSIQAIEQVEAFSFNFDHIFGEDATNEDVFRTVAKPIVEAAVNGFNGTIFAYGQTSSGKTHTMSGDDEIPGIIIQAVRHIFHQINNSINRQFLLRVGYIEIYNEKIYDLLEPQNVDLKIKEKGRGDVFVECQEFIANTEDIIMTLMNKGNKFRRIGSTNMNDRSSRSHTIFRIVIESSLSTEDTDDRIVQESHLNFVDLAGSERAVQSGASGSRLKEAGNINKSLLALSCVIKKLSDPESSDGYVNYRDSKLTRILQASLGGNAMTAIICTITPAAIEETSSTLNFGVSAKRIKNKPVVNEETSDAVLMKRMNKEIRRLQAQLQEMQLKKNDDELLPFEAQINERKSQFLHSTINVTVDKNRRQTWAPSVSRSPLPVSPLVKNNKIVMPPPTLIPQLRARSAEIPPFTSIDDEEFVSATEDILESSLLDQESPPILLSSANVLMKPSCVLKTINYERGSNSKHIFSPSTLMQSICTPKAWKLNVNLVDSPTAADHIAHLEAELSDLADFTKLERAVKIGCNIEEGPSSSIDFNLRHQCEKQLQDMADMLELYKKENIQLKHLKSLDTPHVNENGIETNERIAELELHIKELNEQIKCMQSEKENITAAKHKFEAELGKTIESKNLADMERNSIDFEFDQFKIKSKNREQELIDALHSAGSNPRIDSHVRLNNHNGNVIAGDLDKMRLDHEELQGKYNKLQIEYDELSQQIMDNIEDNESSTKQFKESINQLSSEIDLLKVTMEQQSVALVETDALTRTLNEKIITQTQENSDLTLVQVAMSKTMESDQVHLNERETEIIDLKISLAELQQEKDQEEESLKAHLQQLRDEMAETESKYTALSEKLIVYEPFKAKNEILESMIDEMKRVNNTESDLADMLNKANEEVIAVTNSSSLKLQEMTAELEDIRSKYEQIHAQLGKSEETVAKLECDCHEVISEKEENEKILESAIAKNLELEEELQKSRAQVTHFESEISRLEHESLLQDEDRPEMAEEFLQWLHQRYTILSQKKAFGYLENLQLKLDFLQQIVKISEISDVSAETIQHLLQRKDELNEELLLNDSDETDTADIKILNVQCNDIESTLNLSKLQKTSNEIIEQPSQQLQTELKELQQRELIYQEELNTIRERVVEFERIGDERHSELKRKEQEKDNLQLQLQSTEDNLKCVQVELKALQNEKEALNALVQETDKELINSRQCISEMKRSESNSQNELKRIIQDNENLQIQLQTSEENLKCTKQALHKSEENLECIKVEVDALKSEKDALNAVVQQTEEECNSMRTSCMVCMASIKSLQEENEKLKNEHKECSALIESKENDCKIFLKELEAEKSAKEELNLLKSSELLETNLGVNDIKQEHLEKTEQLQITISTLNYQLTDVQNKLEAQSKQFNMNKYELDIANQTIAMLRKEICQLQLSNSDDVVKLEHLNNEVKRLIQDNIHLDAECSNLRSEKLIWSDQLTAVQKSHKEEIANFSKELSNQTSKLDEESSKLTAVTTQLSEKSLRLAEAQSELTNLKSTLADITSSLSEAKSVLSAAKVLQEDHDKTLLLKDDKIKMLKSSWASTKRDLENKAQAFYTERNEMEFKFVVVNEKFQLAENENDQLKKEYQRIVDQERDQKTKLNHMDTKLKKMEAKCNEQDKKYGTKVQSLEAQLMETNKMLSNSKGNIVKLQSENADLLKQLHEHQKMHIFKKEQFQSQIQKYVSELTELRSKSTTDQCVEANKIKIAELEDRLQKLKNAETTRCQLQGENNELRTKNKQLAFEVDDLRIRLQTDRKSRRQSTHDESRRIAFDGNVEKQRSVEVQTVDPDCGCAEKTKTVRELTSDNRLMRAHLSTMKMTLDNHPLHFANEDLKKKLYQCNVELEKQMTNCMQLSTKASIIATKPCVECVQRNQRVFADREQQTADDPQQKPQIVSMAGPGSGLIAEERNFQLQADLNLVRNKYEQAKKFCNLQRAEINRLKQNIEVIRASKDAVLNNATKTDMKQTIVHAYKPMKKGIKVEDTHIKSNGTMNNGIGQHSEAEKENTPKNSPRNSEDLVPKQEIMYSYDTSEVDRLKGIIDEMEIEFAELLSKFNQANLVCVARNRQIEYLEGQLVLQKKTD